MHERVFVSNARSKLGENPGLKSETWATHSMRSLVAVTVMLEEALHKRKIEPLSELLARFRQSSDGHESK
jgi:hypothetical protein